MFTVATWLLRCVCVTIAVVPASGGARSLFVSNDGDDAQPGTIERPWRTLRASFARLEAGDTLNVRGGPYFEDRLILNANGKPEGRIVIRSAPGDRAWIAGGGSLFIEKESEAWDCVDKERAIFRLKTLVSNKVAGGWLIDQGLQLVPYASLELFASDHHGVGGYIGPGLFLDKTGLRVRLEMPREAAESWAEHSDHAEPKSDPNDSRFFFSAGKGPTLTVRSAAHVLVQDLDWAPGDRRTLEISGSSHHVTIQRCNILVRTLGVITQKGTHDLAIQDCTFRMGFPPWVAWGDVKGGSRGAGFNPADAAGWNSFAIVGVWTASAIERCTFFDCFDGVFLRGGARTSSFPTTPLFDQGTMRSISRRMFRRSRSRTI